MKQMDVSDEMMTDREEWKEREELDGPAVRVLGVRSRKLSNFRKGQSTDG
jgi:hypothetical protein